MTISKTCFKVLSVVIFTMLLMLFQMGLILPSVTSISFADSLLGERLDLTIPTAAARDIGMADFNHDGIQDIVITDVHHNNVILFLGAGEGAFLPPSTFPVGYYPSFLAIGDLNLDNHPDIITSNAVSGPPNFIPYSSISVLMGKGDGTFEELKDYPTTSYYYGDFTLGDFNNDTYPDILLHIGQLLLGNGDGSFQPFVNTGCPVARMTVGDFNYDNNLDIVASYGYAGSIYFEAYLGNGDGTFADPFSIPAGSGVTSINRLTTGDIDHDGILDLIALGSSPYWRCIMTYEGTGDSTLFLSPHLTVTDTAYEELEVHDFDKDGNLDIMAVSFGGVLSFFKGSGLLYPELHPPYMHMPFSDPQNYDTLYSATDLASGDLNDDGSRDIAIIYGQTSFMSLFLSGSASLSSIVRIDDRQIKVQKRLPDNSLDIERPYFIEGIAWQPATIAPETGPDPADPTGFEIDYGFFFTPVGVVPEHMFYWWQQEFENRYVDDIDLMQQMNVNTVRLYIHPGEDGIVLTKAQVILDELYAKDIMVVMTVASGKRDLCSDTMDPICSNPPRYQPVVEMFKDHPAILMWSIANEWNFSWALTGLGFSDLNEAKNLINDAATHIKLLDPNHPVTSALGDDFSNIPGIVTDISAVDIWGMNVYRGTSFGVLFDQWSAMTSKPLYLSEYGTDSFYSTSYNSDSNRAYNVLGSDDETTQADFVYFLHEEVVHHQAKEQNTELCNGGFIFEFNDTLWKAGNYHVGLGGLPDVNPLGSDYSLYNENGFIEATGHPDGVSNQEYFGVVTADRTPKEAFNVLSDSFVPNIPTGTDVEYTDPVSETTLTFDEVVSEGHTEIVQTTSGPDWPSEFELLGNYYDITTTAAFDGMIDVCIGYDDTGLSEQDENDLRLYHYEDYVPVDVTVLPNDIDNNIVCGQVTSLSPFGIFKKTAVEVNLIDSNGQGIAGGEVYYASGSWLSLGTTDANGNLRVELETYPSSMKIKMKYEGKSVELVQDPRSNHVFIFQTVNALVKLIDSSGVGLSGGEAKYAAGSWREIGVTDSNGEVRKELLPGNYKIRMKDEGKSVEQTQDIGVGAVVFQTVNALVQLIDSTGIGLAGGEVKYAAGSWREIGVTDSNGEVRKELLPGNYKIRMKYEGKSIEQTQDISTGAVAFQTVNALIKLQDSSGTGLEAGEASYAAGSWREIGVTDSNGEVRKELLPITYKIRMKYAGSSEQITQDILSNPIVIFEF